MTLIEGREYEQLVSDAMSRETGARGLSASLETAMSDLLFHALSTHGSSRKIRLVVSGGRITGVVSGGNKAVEVEGDVGDLKI